MFRNSWLIVPYILNRVLPYRVGPVVTYIAKLVHMSIMNWFMCVLPAGVMIAAMFVLALYPMQSLADWGWWLVCVIVGVIVSTVLGYGVDWYWRMRSPEHECLI